MAGKVLNEFITCLCPAEDVINNNFGVQSVINSKVALNGKRLPGTIKVVDKDNKMVGPLAGPKGITK